MASSTGESLSLVVGDKVITLRKSNTQKFVGGLLLGDDFVSS